MDIQVRPTLVYAAENALSKAVYHYLLLYYNFPSEAVDCILQLFTAMELLLREYFERKEVVELKTKELIETYWDWERNDKNLAHWLRDSRNSLTHEGESEWEDKNYVSDKLRECFVLIHGVYEQLGYKVAIVFTPLEQRIINGQNLDWDDEALFLAREAIHYLPSDPEIMFDIASTALEMALRGFSRSWRIEGADTLPMQALFDAVYHIKYEYESKYSLREIPHPYIPIYRFPDGWGFDERYLWFAENLEQVFEEFGHPEYSNELTLRLYCNTSYPPGHFAVVSKQSTGGLCAERSQRRIEDQVQACST